MAAMYDGDNNRVFQIDNTYGESGNGERIGVEKNDEKSYYMYDGRGSVTGLVTDDGKLTNSYSYDPYGTLTSGTVDAMNYFGTVVTKTLNRINTIGAKIKHNTKISQAIGSTMINYLGEVGNLVSSKSNSAMYREIFGTAEQNLKKIAIENEHVINEEHSFMRWGYGRIYYICQRNSIAILLTYSEREE